MEGWMVQHERGVMGQTVFMVMFVFVEFIGMVSSYRDDRSSWQEGAMVKSMGI